MVSQGRRRDHIARLMAGVNSPGTTGSPEEGGLLTEGPHGASRLSVDVSDDGRSGRR